MPCVAAPRSEPPLRRSCCSLPRPPPEPSTRPRPARIRPHDGAVGLARAPEVVEGSPTKASCGARQHGPCDRPSHAAARCRICPNPLTKAAARIDGRHRAALPRPRPCSLLRCRPRTRQTRRSGIRASTVSRRAAGRIRTVSRPIRSLRVGPEHVDAGRQQLVPDHRPARRPRSEPTNSFAGFVDGVRVPRTRRWLSWFDPHVIYDSLHGRWLLDDGRLRLRTRRRCARSATGTCSSRRPTRSTRPGTGPGQLLLVRRHPRSTSRRPARRPTSSPSRATSSTWPRAGHASIDDISPARDVLGHRLGRLARREPRLQYRRGLQRYLELRAAGRGPVAGHQQPPARRP